MTAEPNESYGELADLILNVSRLLRGVARDFDAFPLTDVQRTIMRIVDLQPGISPTTIAERARMLPPNVSAALRDLEGHGLIERSTIPGRGVAVRTTGLATTNLSLLRQHWTTVVQEAVGADYGTVVIVVKLLTQLERSLLTPQESGTAPARPVT